MYDAIVVGARVAGSPTAMLLAREGHKVLLVERATFPSDVLSGLYIRLPGAARLKRWGLLDRVGATGAPPVGRFSFDVGPFARVGSAPPAEGVAASYMPRRRLLDPILASAAVEAGAELRTGFSVRELVWEGDRVVGIRGRSATGATLTERARIVVGADGPHSFIVRSVRSPLYNTRPTLTCSYQRYWRGVPVDGAELYVRQGQFIVAGMTNEGLTQVAVLWPIAQFHAVRADIEGAFLRALDEHAPSLAERVRSGRREERFYIPLDYQDPARYANITYRAYGPGELVRDRMTHFVIGHGLFSLLDEFPFNQFPDHQVSIPKSERLVGQGVKATFESFTVTTMTHPKPPVDRAELLHRPTPRRGLRPRPLLARTAGVCLENAGMATEMQRSPRGWREWCRPRALDLREQGWAGKGIAKALG